jgi:hypothetical protein
MEVSSKEKMKQFLSTQALKIREESNCKVCGSPTQPMMTTFTFGDDESWTLPVPICLTCN